MSINDIVSAFGSVFNFLWSTNIFGMPILFWFVCIAVFGIIASFIKGGKDNEK